MVINNIANICKDFLKFFTDTIGFDLKHTCLYIIVPKLSYFCTVVLPLQKCE